MYPWGNQECYKQPKELETPRPDDIPSELIKYRGKEMHNLQDMQKNLGRRAKEQMPKSCKEAVIIIIHKKGDKTKCGNYNGILHLNSTYKVFSEITLNPVAPYIEENLDECQWGFRRERPTIEQIAISTKLLVNICRF